MKKSALKALVNEVVRQCVKEAGPQYKIRGKKSQLEQPGQRNKAREIQSDPQINEDFGAEGSDSPENAEVSYNEPDEVELLKQMAQILIKLLQMHRGEDMPAAGGDEPPVAPSAPDEAPKAFGGPSEPEEPEEPEEPASDDSSNDDEDELKESNHKVQARSHLTVKDLPNNPKNARNAEVPQS